ncbi:MAG: sugar isomerase domain-containing protein [Oscillospiraceae bacterium]|nr:sugar isomerase domain-containing protein [Oscillospiraceae bacterium]
MNKAQEFMDYSCRLIQTIAEQERESIEKAADAVRKTMESGGMLYTYGTGHSTMLCMEPFERAGGLGACYPILDERLMPHTVKKPEERFLERDLGVTEEIFKRYPIKSGDSMFIFCYGGKNATSIDAALLCKKMGVTGIGISCVAQATAVGSTHPSGLLLHQACDISIDTHGPVGDAAIDFGGFTACPISTIAGAAIVQAITARTIELMLADGESPEVLLSANIPAGDKHNEPILEKYRRIIPFM